MASRGVVKNQYLTRQRLDFLEHRTVTLMNMIDAMCRSMGRDFKVMENGDEKFIVWEEVKREN